MLVFSTGFVDYCTSNLFSGKPPPPRLCVNNYTVETYIQCVRGGGGVYAV
jgi:hypothetical protein